MSEVPESLDESEQRVDRRELFSAVRTVVVKLGSGVITREDGGISLGRIHPILEQIVDLRRSGYQVILVSSGAISMGMHELGQERHPAFLSEKQAYAAVGQIRLMAAYQQAFSSYGVPTGQILLTEDDFKNRSRYLNLRNTMSQLLEFGVLPIVNENDSVSTVEIEEVRPEMPGERAAVFGDNDVLSALVASKLGADLLLLLSDVEGLFASGPPGRDPKERPLSVVPRITPEIESMASSGRSSRGRGGMASKIQAASIATQSGAFAVVASGFLPDTVRRVLSGDDVGTLFLPRGRLGSRKRWIAFARPVAGRIEVNRGAFEALSEGRASLLFAGVTQVDGFERGDVVRIVDDAGREFARGIANYGAEEARPLLGKRSEELVQLVGRNHVELIHRDNLAIWR